MRYNILRFAGLFNLPIPIRFAFRIGVSLMKYCHKIWNVAWMVMIGTELLPDSDPAVNCDGFPARKFYKRTDLEIYILPGAVVIKSDDGNSCIFFNA